MQARIRVLAVTTAAFVSLVFAALALADVNAVTFDGTAPLSNDGNVATVTVSASCTAPPSVQGSASVTILQPSGRQLALGSGSVPITCDGTTQTVDILVPTQTTAYKKGWATISVDVSYFDNVTFQFFDKSVGGTIKLTGK